MTDLVTPGSVDPLAALVYELYRATAKAGTSRHDSMQSFARNNIAFYLIAAIVIAFLFAASDWAAWVGLPVLGRGDRGLNPLLQPYDHAGTRPRHHRLAR